VFADTHARVGILPAGGMTARLPLVVGLGMARRLSMTGEVVDAARAERMGLVTEVVPHERLLDRALELAGQIAEVPGPTMASLKEIYTTGAAAVIDPALAAEAKIAFAQHRDFDGLGDQFREVAEQPSHHQQIHRTHKQMFGFKLDHIDSQLGPMVAEEEAFH